jgi:adenylosuccinate lyase
MDQFDLISPLDYRYAREKRFSQYFSERARIRYQAKIEAVLVRVFAEQGLCSNGVADEVEGASNLVMAEDVYAEEQRIKHDIRALVNVIKEKVSKEAQPYVHLAATSYDIIDTSNSLRFKEGTENVVLPALIELEKTLLELAEREKETIQIGRTHGQHAEPTTFGLTLAGYVSRLGKRIKEIETRKNGLVGKFSGAVGAYNASTLIFDNPIAIEKSVMEKLGLQQSETATQIAEAEPLTDLVHAVVSTFSVIADLADDLRHLQRSEIGEIAETFGDTQVGSSTMPHKRNPINFENVKSMYKTFMPRMVTVYLDQLSEHQRDLTNSASQRFLPELFVGLTISAERLNRVMKKLVVDHEAMKNNFDKSAKHIVAEPLYILLAINGHENAHEVVREITLEAEKTGKNVVEIAQGKDTLKTVINKFSKSQLNMLAHPEQYIGKAVEKTEIVCAKWKKEFG